VRDAAARSSIVTELRRLSGRRSSRREANAFVVDGPTLVAEALAAGLAITHATVDRDALAEPRITALAAQLDDLGVDVAVLAPGVLAKATDTVTSQGIAGIAEMPHADLGRLVDRPGLVVVLDSVGDPGNVGTIIRSARGAGSLGVVVGVGSADPFAPKTVRSSAGAVMHLPVVEADAVGAIDALVAAGWRIVGTDAHAAIAYDWADLTGAIALVLGNEAHGVSEAVRERCHEFVSIPLDGGLESLNVGVAASVLCFESARQRRSRSAVD
jgi:TrmH family RNA methyltransferase